LTNDAAVEGSGLEGLCNIAGTQEEYKKIIEELFNKVFTENYITERKKKLEAVYNNHENAQRLIQWIW
jgi:hypothetical protein